MTICFDFDRFIKSFSFYDPNQKTAKQITIDYFRKDCDEDTIKIVELSLSKYSDFDRKILFECSTGLKTRDVVQRNYPTTKRAVDSLKSKFYATVEDVNMAINSL